MPKQAQQAIENILKILLERYQPEKVILFGSLANEAAHEDSDIDLLIVKETKDTPLERRLFVRRLVSDSSRRIPFSPLVITPSELANRLASGDPFYLGIVQQGKTLYAQS